MLIAGMALLLYRLVIADRRQAAWTVAALLLLARETMILAVLPLAIRELGKRRYSSALMWTATVLPLLAWWTWVRYRIGFWPFLDPTVAYSRPFDLPFLGFLALLWDPDSGTMLRAATSVGWATLIAAMWIHVARPWFPLTAGAVASALLVVFFGPGQANLPGEAFRVMLPAQVLVAIAWLCRREPVTRRSSSVSNPAEAPA
jgi:hypothetical protein